MKKKIIIEVEATIEVGDESIIDKVVRESRPYTSVAGIRNNFHFDLKTGKVIGWRFK